MKAGSRLTLNVTALDDEGAGVALFEGGREAAEVHVAGALPGEVVRAAVEHVSPHRGAHGRRAWARLDGISSASAERVAPLCRAHGLCGGCPLQHLAGAAQTRWKCERVRAALVAQPGLPPIPVDDCVPSPVSTGYRNQSKLAYGHDRAGRARLGAFAPRSHEVVDVSGCRLVEPAIEAVSETLRRACTRRRLVPFDPATGAGDLRHVALRANARGEVLVTLVCPARDGRAPALLADLGGHREIVGVVCNVNRSPGDAVFGDEEHVLVGAGVIEDELLGQRVRLAPRTFFQLNRHVAALIYAAIAEHVASLAPFERLVDAYAGVAPIARLLSAHVGEAIAIEINPAVTAEAAAPARLLSMDAAAGLASLDAADLVVLNPPRAGATPAALAAVVRLRPRMLVYLSCNPKTLARDLVALVQAGYVVTRATPFDMLPHTAHVETLVLLARA